MSKKGLEQTTKTIRIKMNIVIHLHWNVKNCKDVKEEGGFDIT